MKKKIPHFNSDEEMEAFLEQDLSDYLHPENFVKANFEFLPKDTKVNLRMPENLLLAIKKKAKDANMPYQRYIRHLMEVDVRPQG